MSTESFKTEKYLDYDLLPIPHELLIGEAFAMIGAAGKKWQVATDSGDKETANKMIQLIHELDEKANEELLHATLNTHGYSTTTESVVLEPIKTIGWGKESGSILGGIRQQTIIVGEQVVVKVKDINWSCLTSGNVSDVTVNIPGTSQRATLLYSTQIKTKNLSGVETKEPSKLTVIETIKEDVEIIRKKLNKILNLRGSLLGVVKAAAHHDYGKPTDYIVSIPLKEEEIVLPPGTSWEDIKGCCKNVIQTDFGYFGGGANIELDEEGIAKLKKLAEKKA